MYRKIHKQIIQLAPNEWGNQLMHEVAKEWLVMHSHLIRGNDHIVCCVWEHAGWALSFTLGRGGDVMVVGSANDMAQYRGEAGEWREKAYPATREQVAYPIRRPVEAETYNTIVLPSTLAGVT